MKDRLKEIRTDLGMTQEEFARDTKKNRGSIASYETGRVIPDGTFVELLAVKYGYSEDWILTGKEPKKTAKDLGIEMGEIVMASARHDPEEVDAYIQSFFRGWPTADRLIFYEILRRNLPNLCQPGGQMPREVSAYAEGYRAAQEVYSSEHPDKKDPE